MSDIQKKIMTIQLRETTFLKIAWNISKMQSSTHRLHKKGVKVVKQDSDKTKKQKVIKADIPSPATTERFVATVSGDVM